MCLVQVKIFQKVIDLASKLFLLLNSQIFLFKIDIMIYEECKKKHFEYLPDLGALCDAHATRRTAHWSRRVKNCQY